MAVLALDLGRRVTGVACFDVSIGFPFPLDAIESRGVEEVVAAIVKLAGERRVETIIMGLPLLPDGREGEQSDYAHTIGDRLIAAGLRVHFLDERYTSHTDTAGENDHAKAAVALLQMALERRLI